jgi:hypothetical chaperone protein
MKVEEGKIALSAAESVTLDLDRLAPPELLTVARGTFEDAILPLVDAIDRTVLQLLGDAGVTVDQVDTVFFTGGSSGVGLLRQRIAALVPNARKVEGDLFGSIGAGLALDAQRKFG